MGSTQKDFYKCNLQRYLLFSTFETLDTLVHYNCKSFIELNPECVSFIFPVGHNLYFTDVD